MRGKASEDQACPLFLFFVAMKKLRHYRGGFEFAGLKLLARELRQDQTSAEELLWSLLRNRQLLGFKFRRQHQFGKYVADFYCRDAQLVIECDGAPHDRNEQWQHDQARDTYMELQGLKVLRFSNRTVLTDIESVLDQIAAYLGSDAEASIREETI
jgi:very-short-patch-repair endonuclease